MPEEAVILLVEDRQDDEILVLRSFDKAGIKNPIHVVREGEEAVAYLSGSGKYSNREDHPLPVLVLLDLKMPKMDGFEVLKWIRAHAQLSGLLVVVLTSSDSVRDVNLAYRLGANSFLVKPMDFNGFVELSSFISDHWFLWAKTPATSHHASGHDWEPTNNKVLLRDKQSHAFYAGYTAWVGERREALDFERIELAEAVATAEQLREAEIVLAYEQLGCEVTLPIAFPVMRRT
jgi:CheY-like chemotaxis protein